MDSGVYLLDFEQYGVYIGQSLDVQERYWSHCSLLDNGKNAPNLQDAFYALGRYPKLKTLVVCHADWLLKLETYYIHKYSKYKDGTILLNKMIPKVSEEIPASIVNNTHPVLNIKLSLIDNWYALEHHLKYSKTGAT